MRLSSELEEKIEAEREQGPYKIPRSEVIRVALEEYFGNGASEQRGRASP